MRKFLISILLALTVCACQLDTPQESPRIRIARENASSVVVVNVLYPSGGTATATGFILTSDGLVATNRHVIQNAAYINLTLNNGQVSAEAKPIALTQQVDLALLKIPAKNLHPVQLGNSSTVQPGQSITVIGNPRRLQNTVSDGIVSQIRRKPNGILWHQITAPLSPSSSGSPVFNGQGEVVSVAFASYSGENNQNLNFAVPVNYLIHLVRKAGYTLPAPISKFHYSSNPFIRHLQKSVNILKLAFSLK